MTIFIYLNLSMSRFWQYLSRLNEYRAQYVHFVYEKWEICDVLLEGITYDTRTTLEFMCYSGLDSLNADDMLDLLESLTSYKWQCKCASEAFVSPPPYICMINLYA